MGTLRKVRWSTYLYDSISTLLDTLTTFVVRTGGEPDASQLNLSHLSCDSQISAVSRPRIEDDESVAGISMRAICEVVTQTSSTRTDSGPSA